MRLYRILLCLVHRAVRRLLEAAKSKRESMVVSIEHAHNNAVHREMLSKRKTTVKGSKFNFKSLQKKWDGQGCALLMGLLWE